MNKTDNMMRLLKIIGCLGLLCCLLVSCRKNRLDIKVSKLKEPLQITRLDQELFSRDPGQLIDSIAEIHDKVGDYFDIYSYNIIGVGGIGDEGFEAELSRFVSDSVYRQVADSVLIMFHDFSTYRDQIELGFRHYQYYFPEKVLPRMYTQFSGFNQSIVVDEQAVAISLDKYMGSDCVFYQYLGIPEYKRKAMYPAKMVADLFYAIGQSTYPFQSGNNHLLDQLIYQGKLLYFTEAMCPTISDSVLTGFSAHQIQWCQKNEVNMWTYLAEKKLLYASDRLVLRKFIGDAPFTPDFSESSPGRAVVWIGWQIIRSYMEHHPELTLDQLFENYDGQSVLAASGYYPR